jgi:ATPase subunit of ABC transporter with duplicated ATPase domains
MQSLRAIDLYFAYGGGEPVLDHLNFHLNAGWTGLVGANGSGKTTLLRLLVDELEPSDGTLVWSPERPRIAVCPQRVEARERYESFATSWTGDALRWMSLLELEPDDFWRWDELSPGMRKRWQVAATFHDAPAVALLDEPTNHLDRAGKEVLRAAMSRFDGLGIVVSHDRDFLDSVCDDTLWLTGDDATLYSGGYSDARAARDADIARQNAKMEALQAERDRLQAQLADKRGRASRANAAISSRTRMTSIRDSDGRSMSAKGRAQRAAASLSGEAGAARSRLEGVREELSNFEYRDTPGSELRIDHERPTGSRTLRFDRDQITRGDGVILRDVSLRIEAGQHIWLDAPNGAGKTTLIEEWVAELGDEVLFLPQTLSDQEVESMLEDVRALPRDRLGRLMNLVAALGAPPEAFLDTRTPSPGMARKLALARGLLAGASLVVLDEPTNHLDITSIERLEAALASYPGALLLVTHDTAMARAVTERRWTIRDSGVLQEADVSPY